MANFTYYFKPITKSRSHYGYDLEEIMKKIRILRSEKWIKLDPRNYCKEQIAYEKRMVKNMF